MYSFGISDVMDETEEDPGLVCYGTPLDPLTEDDAHRFKKPIPVEDQIVTDENGRRRFHGAFTGGFSAGFFNTAGSRDGWSPAHFKSSRLVDNATQSFILFWTRWVSFCRSDRKEAKAQRPEDFMDAEDLGEFGIAPQAIKTSSQFRQPQSKEEEVKKKRMQPSEVEGPIPGDPVFDQLFKPASETIGKSVSDIV